MKIISGVKNWEGHSK